jgi:hypothetical protein
MVVSIWTAFLPISTVFRLMASTITKDYWRFLYGISEHKRLLTAIGTLRYIRTDYVRAHPILYETTKRNKKLTFSKRVRLSGGASLLDKKHHMVIGGKDVLRCSPIYMKFYTDSPDCLLIYF